MERKFNNSDAEPTGFYGNYSKKPTGLMNGFSEGFQAERDLYSMIITEHYNKRGVKTEFYVTTVDPGYDPLFGDDDDRRLRRKFELMVYYNYPKEDKLWTSFGIEGLDSFSMYCSKEHFDAVSRCDENGADDVYEAHIPQVGDLIRVEFNNYIYEITEVKDEAAMYLQSKQYAWELIVKPFINEHMGVEDLPIDDEVRAAVEVDDLFDISGDIDDVVDDIKYEPTSQDDIDFDPFGNW
jgi:hypothetical protein